MTYQIYTDTTNILPYQISTDIGESTYIFKIIYNDRFDFYTLYIYDSVGNLLLSTKITYFDNLIKRSIDKNLDNSKIAIIFVDELEFISNVQTYLHVKVDSTNFHKSVFMVILDVNSI